MMEAYIPLLERTHLPHPSLQRYAVIQLFSKLRSDPDPDSGPGREALTRSLNSHSPAVVDQSLRELCCLAADGIFPVPAALLEVQAALEGSLPRFVGVFVKAIGFLIRVGFRSKGLAELSFDAPLNHPFIKVLSCRPEVQDELVQQVILFVVHGEQYGIAEVCDYLRPLLTFSISRVCSSDSQLSSFLSRMVSSLMSLCCSLLDDAFPLLDMLIGCLRCFHVGAGEDLKFFAESLVDAHIVILQRLVKMKMMVPEAQLSGVKLLDTLLTLCLDLENYAIGSKPFLRLSRRLMSVHRELGLQYMPELFPPMLSLLVILTQLELEDEELYVLDFLAFFLKWKAQNQIAVAGVACQLSEVHLFFFPVIGLMSSPSKTIKQAASELLLMSEELLINNSNISRCDSPVQRRAQFTSKLETIIFRLLQHLWLQDLPSCSFFLNCFAARRNDNALENGSKSWLSQVGNFASSLAESRTSSLSVSLAEEVILAETPLLFSALVGSLLVHHALGNFAVDTLAALSNVEPKLGITLLLAVLYYSSSSRRTIKCSTDMLLKLLGVLPSLASHSAILPLIVQTIMPMLHKDSHPVLYATSLRLLCKAWEMNDRAFGSLHNFLLPERFSAHRSDKTVAVSMAASVRDICKRNPDKGIELILSVAVCIECCDSSIQALGLQSLGYLCEADAVDFYTAWDVIAKHVKEYLTDPVVAYSLCLLLRWAAVDAEAYEEASGTILQILWDIGNSDCPAVDPLWKKARITALEAINCFEVLRVASSIQDLKDKATNLLITETDVDILRVLGELETKIIAYEFSTRRRLVKEKKAPRSKIEKLLDVFPRVMFSSGRCQAKDLPGAALFCLSFSPRDASSQGNSKTADAVFAEYRYMLKEVAASLHLSRNIYLALLSLQSWKSFMEHWLKDYTSVLDVKASSTLLDKTSKAANDILKGIIQVAEDSIPRVAENIALAMGAFCLVSPAAAHPVKMTASKFLLKWLCQYEHEHRQWSAAIAVGVISSCLHATDRQQKLQCIDGLIKVASTSTNCFVKGACGIGLGYSCQDLLIRNTSDVGSFTLQEKALLGKIVRTLSTTICQLTKTSPDILGNLSEYKPSDIDENFLGMTSEMMLNSCEDLGEDMWGIAGLVLGLGTCVSALFRAGSYEAICNIKMLCTSWIAEVDSLVSDSNSCNMMLSTGACLVLPTIASFCLRMGKMLDDDINDILSSYENLITRLLLVKTSNTFHHNLLLASCAGAGALLACILDRGVISLDVQQFEKWVDLFRKIYSGTYPHLVHLGAFIGVVNTMGADAGSTVHYSTKILQTLCEREDSLCINGPLLSSSSVVKNLSDLMQDIFLVAQDSDDIQLQAYAAWAITSLGNHLWSKELHRIDGSDADNQADSKPMDHNFSKDTTVVKLASWLRSDQSTNLLHVNTVAAVLRCLSCAPRLPKLDWGAVVMRLMRYEPRKASCLPQVSSCEKRTVLEECLRFALAHANKFDTLLALVDDLTDLFRFRTLDLVTQSCLLFHLLDLMRIFSNSRIQKLLEDIYDFLSSPVSPYQKLNARQKRFLQLSCWKGLSKCVNEPSLDTSECISGMEKCMDVLFGLLPSSKQELMLCLQWKEAIACLGKARRAWLMNLLQISSVNIGQRDTQPGADAKKMIALAKLVKFGSVPLSELGKLKSYMLNTKSEGMWEVLVEVVAVLQAAGGAMKRQWLIDVLEISCITKYPSTALQFLGLLCGSSCQYMPLLVLDPRTVLVDLPITLTSLLSSTKWRVVADTAVSSIWKLTLRLYNWVMSLARDDEQPNLHPIDESETEACNLLLRVMLDACQKLIEFLPLNNQLQLANMAMY